MLAAAAAAAAAATARIVLDSTMLVLLVAAMEYLWHVLMHQQQGKVTAEKRHYSSSLLDGTMCWQ
jgi:hypothetical protein